MGWLNKLFNLDSFKAASDAELAASGPNPTYGNKQTSASGSSASKRLKLVLMHDRTQLSPAMMEQMRDELVEVISKYVVIDKDALDINLESESNTIALVANIPVLRTRAGSDETLSQQNLIQPSEALPNAVVRQPDATSPEARKVNPTVTAPANVQPRPAAPPQQQPLRPAQPFAAAATPKPSEQSSQ